MVFFLFETDKPELLGNLHAIILIFMYISAKKFTVSFLYEKLVNPLK